MVRQKNNEEMLQCLKETGALQYTSPVVPSKNAAPKTPAPKTPAPKTPAPKTPVMRTPVSKTPVSKTPGSKSIAPKTPSSLITTTSIANPVKSVVTSASINFTTSSGGEYYNSLFFIILVSIIASKISCNICIFLVKRKIPLNAGAGGNNNGGQNSEAIAKKLPERVFQIYSQTDIMQYGTLGWLPEVINPGIDYTGLKCEDLKDGIEYDAKNYIAFPTMTLVWSGDCFYWEGK